PAIDTRIPSHRLVQHYYSPDSQEKTEEEMKEFEEELLKRAAKVRNPGGSANNASATPDSDF
ncbi:hypothetical protein BOX15_Mlig031657g1, partial [Macrostomum lignano]